MAHKKKDVFKRSIPLDYEIYGEKRHADSAIEMYLYVMEKILTKNAAPLDRQQIRDLYTTVDCFYDCSKLIANGNFDGNTEEMVQFIKKKGKRRQSSSQFGRTNRLKIPPGKICRNRKYKCLYRCFTEPAAYAQLY